MNTKMKLLKWLVAITVGIIGASNAGATGVLGTPVDGTIVSGVGVISGYHCTSKDIEVFIDGVSLGKAGAGTQLLGTQGVCGRTDTGFSLLYNFNNLPNGQHTFSVYADGVLFDQHTVTTFQSGGMPWLSGQSAAYTLPDFPAAGQTATVQWVQSYQNFLITSITGTQTQVPPPSTGGVSETCGLERFTAANYNAIQVGMTLDQVIQIMGCNYDSTPGLTSYNTGPTGDLVTYAWTNSDVVIGMFIAVTFDLPTKRVTNSTLFKFWNGRSYSPWAE